MRVARLGCLVAVLLALAGCASGSQTVPPNAPAGSTAPPTSAAPSGAAPSSAAPSKAGPGSTSRPVPAPAPSDSDGLQVSGPVAVSLLSRAGPLQPAGPYLGRTVTELLGRYRAALSGDQPSCPASGCWPDAKIPNASMLLAVRPATVACYQLLSIHTATPASGIEVDLQLNYVCRPGAGTGARMTGWLFGLPLAALPASGRVSVRASLRPGTAFTDLGSAPISK